MKIKSIFVMVMALTVVFAFAGVGVVKAQLDYTSMEGTWWLSKQQKDTGYVLPFPPGPMNVNKAKKFKHIIKKGYMYIPLGSWDDNMSTYYGVVAIDPDGMGGWMQPVTYDLVVLGGTTIDIVSYTLFDAFPILRMVLTVRATLKEDKKNPGTIKSGQVKTLGCAIQYTIPPAPAGTIFVGKRDLKANMIPENKVPSAVKALVP